MSALIFLFLQALYSRQKKKKTKPWAAGTLYKKQKFYINGDWGMCGGEMRKGEQQKHSDDNWKQRRRCSIFGAHCNLKLLSASQSWNEIRRQQNNNKKQQYQLKLQQQQQLKHIAFNLFIRIYRLSETLWNFNRNRNFFVLCFVGKLQNECCSFEMFSKSQNYLPNIKTKCAN